MRTSGKTLITLAIINAIIIAGVLGWITWVLAANATTFDDTEITAVVKTIPSIIAACLAASAASFFARK